MAVTSLPLVWKRRAEGRLEAEPLPPQPPGLQTASVQNLSVACYEFLDPIVQQVAAAISHAALPARLTVRLEVPRPESADALEDDLLPPLLDWAERSIRAAVTGGTRPAPFDGLSGTCRLHVTVKKPSDRRRRSGDNKTAKEPDSLWPDRLKPPPEPAETALNRLVGKLADESEAARLCRAEELGPVVATFLRATTIDRFADKSHVAETIADALARLELSFFLADRPCRLVAARDGPQDTIGRWQVVFKGEREPVSDVESTTELPPQHVKPAPGIGPWQAKEEARKKTISPPSSPVTAGGRYAPLVATHRLSKDDLATQLLGPLKDRLRDIPHATYDEKQQATKWVNEQLRDLGLAVRCPKTGQAAILLAGTLPGGRSKFIVIHYEGTFEKRSFSTQNLDVLVAALSLMPSRPHRGSTRG